MPLWCDEMSCVIYFVMHSYVECYVMLSLLMIVLAPRSEHGQLMLKTAVTMSSALRYTFIIHRVFVFTLKQWLLKAEHSYFADAINLFVIGLSGLLHTLLTRLWLCLRNCCRTRHCIGVYVLQQIWTLKYRRMSIDWARVLPLHRHRRYWNVRTWMTVCIPKRVPQLGFLGH